MLILHGDNLVESRRHLEDIKKGQPAVVLGPESAGEDLVAVSRSSSLFGGANMVVVENLFSGRPSLRQKDAIAYLSQHPDAELIIWESKDVSAKIKDFDPRLVRRFDLPKIVFKFLDDLSLNSLLLALGSTPPEQILALLAGQIRKLIKYQVSRYSLSQLITMNSELLAIDYAQKTSAVPYDLATALQLFVVRLR